MSEAGKLMQRMQGVEESIEQKRGQQKVQEAKEMTTADLTGMLDKIEFEDPFDVQKGVRKFIFDLTKAQKDSRHSTPKAKKDYTELLNSLESAFVDLAQLGMNLGHIRGMMEDMGYKGAAQTMMKLEEKVYSAISGRSDTPKEVLMHLVWEGPKEY